MAKIGFIGLGNMGLPMAKNLIAAGHDVTGFDLVAEANAALVEAGGKVAGSAAECVAGNGFVITMLPAGKHVCAVYGESVLTNAQSGAQLIDCSTIDVDSARAVTAQAAEAGFDMLDAPVSGGTTGAAAGTLTFMVGGSDVGFALAKPLLEIMGKTLVHAGGAGNGQAAKICNNMILGISMLAVCEGFTMAEKLGVDTQKLFDITSTASAQCWAINTYCPVPGPVPTSPANRDYQPGFTTAMMSKDMNLSQDASNSAGANTPLGAQAAEMYEKFMAAGNGELDFSSIIRMVRGN